MPNLPSIELLEATHKFPCKYVFKAIGKNDAAFVARVLDAVRTALSLAEEPPHQVRHTADQRHVAVTLELPVESAAEVHAVYSQIMLIEGLLVLL